ncbi:MAG: ABC transporter ATP-binding protein [Bacteroidales bacterium]|jgi:lipopolysaccharide transport system ATP-binding protein|nr:ABC transporter ATP-binding protein [Bacteroidales bacterium]
MSKAILEIENVSKQYRLGYVGTGTLSDDAKRWWYSMRGKEDPFMKVGEENKRGEAGDSEYVWALRDINLQVHEGEVLGIIGANGAGKSTLLKLLSRVTGPTTGKITARGRIASLLEVGTGFHPELTGRENIYLNGAILGMTKQEINSKLDEIIDFSGCERYIDTPVKRYSSGMNVRLGFAVAAHLEPEILIVDEVLAVGDAEFQKKAIGKMKDVSKGQGRTVLFVSHNMDSIAQLCNRSILLKNGNIIDNGNTKKIIEKYIINQDLNKYSLENPKKRSGTKELSVNKVQIERDNKPVHTVFSGKPFTIRIKVKSQNNNKISNLVVGFGINNMFGRKIFSDSSKWEENYFEKESHNDNVDFLIHVPGLPIIRGNYILDVILSNGIETIDFIEHCAVFNIDDDDFSYGLDRSIDHGDIKINCLFEMCKVSPRC